MANYSKIASLKVKDGTYINKEGVEKNRYAEVGVLLASPHASQLLIKLNATPFSDSRLVSVYLDDGVKLNLEREDTEEMPTDIPDAPITMDDIPF